MIRDSELRYADNCEQPKGWWRTRYHGQCLGSAVALMLIHENEITTKHAERR